VGGWCGYVGSFLSAKWVLISPLLSRGDFKPPVKSWKLSAYSHKLPTFPSKVILKEALMSLATETDLITAVLARDWAAVGGWSLFIGLCLFIVIGAFREWWVPGARYRRLEVSAEKMQDANTDLTTQNGQLITANEITKHFFEETTPKRGERKT
jgi:hypothetical protein